MSAGRPSNYESRFCDLLIEHLAQGRDLTTFPAVLFKATDGKVKGSRALIKYWVETQPEFAEAKELGLALSEYWWETQGLNGLHAPREFNSTVWIFAMKNKFAWRDAVKATIEGEDGGAVKVDHRIQLGKMTDAELLALVQGVTRAE